MATQVQFRRGTTTQNNAFTGAVGEITYDTDIKTLRLHDGTNAGGGATVVTLEATQTLQNKTHSTNSTWEGDAIGIAYGGTGASLTATAGAVTYGTATGIGFSLAGTSGQILSSGGTSSPTWINASSLTVGTATTATRASNIDGGSAGYLVYQVDTNDTGFIAPGASGTILRSTGASTAPSWVTSALTIGTTPLQVGDTEDVFDGIDQLNATGTSHWTLPVGTTAERPGTPADGMVRYNTTLSSFEGYGPGNAWGSLGGVIDVDQDTKLTTETSAGSDEDTFTFTAAGSEVATLNGTTFEVTTGQMIITSTDSLQIPVGTTAQRDGTPVAGQIRYNSTISSFEGYGPGNAWGSLGGVKDVDQDTYLLTEASAGSDEDTFEFYNATVNTLSLSGTAFDLKSPVTMTVNNTTDASSSTTGAVIIDGGVGIAKKLYVGTDADVGGDLQVDGSATVSTNLVVTGDLTVNGTTSTVNTTNLVVTDSLIELSNGAASASNDAGFIVERGSTGDNAAFVWDESADSWVAATTTATGASTGALTLTNAPIIASNITASGTLAVTSTLSAATGSTIGNLTLANGSITDSSGAISFGNENLSTTGTLSAGNATLGTIGSGAITSTGAISGTSLNVSTGAVTAGSLDISGNADIDGTMEADAYTVNGTALNEYISDTVGAMVTSNTESGISVTYDDADNTLDFNVNDPTITLTGAVTGSATMTNLGNVSISTTVAANSVALGTDTTGNYMVNVSAGSGISISHTQGEGSTATISHSDTSSQSSVNNSGLTFIQDVTLDGFGHVTGLGSATVTSSSLGLGTANDVRFDSFGVGTNASGTTGEIRATNQITSFYSDARLKSFEGTIDNALEKVMSLNGYYFKTNARAEEIGYKNDARQVGVSAQEVEKILPEIIAPAPINDMIPSEQERDYKTVHYEKLVPLLIEAIKEQQSQIDELKKKLGE